MTSKEAIQVLKNHNNRKYELVNKRRYAVSIIEQDLEVLDILKTLAKGVIDLKEKNIDITKYVVLISESTNEKIKQWVEGD